MQTIGDKIKELRKQKGVSQEEAAFELGVTRQTVSKWESGAMQPNAESIRMLSDYFAVSPVYFFGGEQSAEETETSQAVPEPATATELAPLPAPKPAKDKKRAFIICLVLLIVSVIVFTLCMLFTVGFGMSYFTNNRGYYTVIDPIVKPMFIGCLIGSIISLGAIAGLVAALINLRKET